MVCVTYTAPVTVQTPLVSGLTANIASGGNGIAITWNQDISGTVKVYLDSVLKATLSGYAGYNQYIIATTATNVNHQICVE